MMKTSLLNVRDRFAPQSRWGAVELEPRRNGRGIFSPSAAEMRQPQDGAVEVVAEVKMIPSAMLRGQFGAAFARLNEPEDARITGATRSLGRRLLGLNVAKPVQAVRQAVMPQRALMLTSRSQVA